MPTLPTDYEYPGNDAFTGDPTDPENVDEFRIEERVSNLETNDAVQDSDIDDLEAATTGYSCRVKITANESIANSADTLIPWDAEDFDNGGFWSSGTLLTVPTGAGGLYSIVAQAEWDTNTTNKRQHKIEVNGSNVAWTVVNIDQANEAVQVAVLYELAAGDTVGFEVRQTSGSARLLSANRTWLSLARIHT